MKNLLLVAVLGLAVSAVTGIQHSSNDANGHPSRMQFASSEVVPLPEGGTPLPLLSLIGFVILVGGISTAIRDR